MYLVLFHNVFLPYKYLAPLEYYQNDWNQKTVPVYHVHCLHNDMLAILTEH